MVPVGADVVAEAGGEEDEEPQDMEKDRPTPRPRREMNVPI